MTKSYFTTTPAQYLTPVYDTKYTLTELPLIGKINIRANANQPAFTQSMKNILGYEIPKKCDQVSFDENTSIFCLGPDEWLLHCPIKKTSSMIKQLGQELKTTHHAINDVSDYYAILQLTGDELHQILQKSSPADLSPASFPINSVLQTHFGHANILLWHQRKNCMHIQCRCSYVDYLWNYFQRLIELH